MLGNEMNARSHDSGYRMELGSRTQSYRSPDFLGIGAIKSGTTWLWANMREHPGIYMPSMKEVEFFDTRFDRGITWYYEFFRDAGRRTCGEISPQYVHCPNAFDRIRRHLEDVKILLAFRNPVERAYSHFMMDAREHQGLTYREKAALFDTLVERGGSKYVRYGLYAEQARPYLEFFGPERVLAVFFEDLTKDPRGVLRSVFGFLNVDTDFVPTFLHTRINESKRYRSVNLFNFLRTCVHTAERFGLAGLVLYLKRTSVRSRVLRMLEVSEQYEPMLPRTRNRLAEFYQDSNHELGKMFGRDLAVWK